MAAGFSVGVSSYNDGSATSPHGQVQVVASAIVADQVSSLCYEFDTQYPGALARGDRLTVNEGIRSRARQKSLRDAWDRYRRYGTPFATLAALCYTSTHDETRGSALDFGVTRKDGSNRAMTVAEAAWVHAHGVARGIRWTGESFVPQEQWHHNGGYAYTLPPIVGVNRPGASFFTDQQSKNDDELRRLLMTASDTITAYQRQDPKTGKDQDTYFVTGPGVFADIVVNGVASAFTKRTGLSARDLRTRMVEDGITFKKCAARDYDERRSFWASLADVAQGKVAA